MDSTTIRLVTPDEFESLQAELIQVYLYAFRQPPYSKSQQEVETFAHFLPLHITDSGFRLVIATQGEQLLGFAYGRRPSPGQPWHDFVAEVLQAAGEEAWLKDAYQLAEMAVLPESQGRGIGGRLHDRLLQDLPQKRALLTTMAANSPAYRLYLRKGWKLLVDDLIVPDLPRPYRVMGLELLPLPQGPM
jgi:GNAT superfamily N-acetyltransferase